MMQHFSIENELDSKCLTRFKIIRGTDFPNFITSLFKQYTTSRCIVLEVSNFQMYFNCIYYYHGLNLNY